MHVPMPLVGFWYPDTPWGPVVVEQGVDEALVRLEPCSERPRLALDWGRAPKAWQAAESFLSVLGHDPWARWPAELPVDPVGTAFQKKVWHALRGWPVTPWPIPYGVLARAIGHPGAARAVASACAANRLAVVVPCHRVVRSDGQATDYRWGRDRRAVLDGWAADAARLR